MYTYLSDYGNGVPNYNAGIDLSYKYRSPYYIAFKVGVAADFSQSLFKVSNCGNAINWLFKSYCLGYECESSITNNSF